MASFDFQKIEERVLKFWEERDIFRKSLEIRSKAKRFVFFEGPPTANGRPGMHHFIGRAFKDLFNRYKTMRGFYVLRKAGWDTHGLPVELEVEKELGFKSKKDIETYGIGAFNAKARENVWRYKKEWEEFTRKMGFWVDLEHPYVTYESGYMESLWSILKTIWDKKLLYLAHKVVPFCTRCGTPLSSHEVAQGYKTVKEQSVYLKFKVKSENLKITDQSGKAISYKLDAKSYILAWTTTPWTLPGNVALAVGKDIIYAVATTKEGRFILARELAEKVLGAEYTVEQELKGADLVGLEYEPLFDIPSLKTETAYKVYPADFVSTTDGTGVVHTAVMYGEDDYVLGMAVGLPAVHTVDEAGKFIGTGPELDGKYVKDKATEDFIIAQLQANGNLLKMEPYEHEYPFCWRCGNPLLYYAKTSWFIKMSAIRDQLIKNNEKINWVPAHLKEGRFGQWLKEVKDWAISRERYWGTPLPIWKCVKCDNLRVVGSVKELERDGLASGNTYFVLRHGATTRNEATQMIISADLEKDTYHLTPEGEKMVERSVEQFKVLEDGIDMIFASPFLRTKETAQIAGRMLHQSIQIDERLYEVRHGSNCEGKSHNMCPSRDKKVEFAHPQDGGETQNDIRRRMMNFIRELEEKYKGKRILIVSHGDPIWLLDKIALGLTEAEIMKLRMERTDWYPSLAQMRQLEWKNIPRNELGELDLHRPYIDRVVLQCDKKSDDGTACKAEMRRIPELADVWFDSGAMPFAQWHWPMENEKLFKEQFPAEFICEAIDQTRGWFYTLLAESTLLGVGAPFKNVLCYSHVLDEKGQKMSKSKGNVVLPSDMMAQYGVDTIRWYFYTLNAPGEPKMFSPRDVQDRLTGFMSTIQNCLRFYELYKTDTKTKPEIKNLLDKWILSRFHGLLALVTERMDAYDPMTAARAIERFTLDDLSNWWLRRSRKRKEALPLLKSILLDLAKVLAPFTPFTAEDMHMRLHTNVKPSDESIHLHDWPKISKKFVDAKLEEEMLRVQQVVAAGLAIRKEKQIKVRQPLASVTVSGGTFASDLETLIREELNVKTVKYQKSGDLALDLSLTSELKAEGYARELIRQIQDMRKEAKYAYDDRVYCQWFSQDAELSDIIVRWEIIVRQEAALGEMTRREHDTKPYDIEKEVELIPGKKVWIGLRK